MPTESTPSVLLPSSIYPQGAIKCSICGLGNLSGGSSTNGTNEGIVVLSDPIERICGRCINTPNARRRISVIESELEIESDDESGIGGLGVGLGLRGLDMGEDRDDRQQQQSIITREDTPSSITTNSISNSSSSSSSSENSSSSTPKDGFSRSLPTHHPRPWRTSNSIKIPKSVSTSIDQAIDEQCTPERVISPIAQDNVENERPPNPLLDIAKARVHSVGRGALYPGSIFKGTQTSGRSAYEVEIQLIDVNFIESSVSGYLSISHLTDSHPHLTTFFDGEIIGPQYGFITGPRFGATEHDDMRHWGRFEQFRRPTTRSDMVRPELYFRDPLPDRSKGEIRAKERDFVFLRIKERFLVPDHKLRDISGASFAGFYYALVDLSPPSAPLEPSTPTSPATPKLPFGPPSPVIIRRGSSQADVRGNSTRPDGKRRESSSKLRDPPIRGEATIRGYYFHSLNQEPFQELFLSHIPQRSSSTFEFR
ncbi:uncharacterized protein IL334_002763 [Kwoniella shivajii]|uniref:Uncharacterized protein n=1 Tax=Kwoniella shivajii TaxID=564305 RepID=A0ABZ1CVM8_9TREE|nr:hypothetical protein IL334_002763 [Kwoniella shivajii]